MSWPLSLQQNQDKIKFVNFKGFHPRSLIGLTLPLSSAPNSHLWPGVGTACWELASSGGISGRPLGILRFAPLGISHWNLQSWEKRGTFVGLGVEWLLFCWSSWTKSPTQQRVTSFSPWPMLQDQFFSQYTLTPKASWWPLLGQGGFHSPSLARTSLPTLTVARLVLFLPPSHWPTHRSRVTQGLAECFTGDPYNDSLDHGSHFTLESIKAQRGSEDYQQLQREYSAELRLKTTFDVKPRALLIGYPTTADGLLPRGKDNYLLSRPHSLYLLAAMDSTTFKETCWMLSWSYRQTDGQKL